MAKKKATKSPTKRVANKKATKKKATNLAKKATKKKATGRTIENAQESTEGEFEEAEAVEVVVGGEVAEKGAGETLSEQDIETLRRVIPKKFWQEDPWRALLDPTLVKDSKMLQSDLAALVREFFRKMLEEEIVDFRIAGMAIHSAAKMHHWKILDVIKEEEKIEIQRQRERTKRQIPKTLPQPLRETRKVATIEDLVGAMRRAIIETMQKREKLRRRREAREARLRALKKTRAKGQLPKELLKHLTGKKMTIEEVIETWYERIRTSVELSPKKETTTRELKDLIELEASTPLERRFHFVRMFLALCFLGTRGRIKLFQPNDFEDISIELPKRGS